MRKIACFAFFFSLILFQVALSARDDRNTTFRPPKDWMRNVFYEQVVDVPGVKAEVLLERSKKWHSKVFPSLAGEAQKSGAAPEALVFEGQIKETWKKGGSSDEQTVLFTITVEAIEGRARMTFSRFTLDHPLPNDKKGRSENRRNVPIEECLDDEGFPHDNATEKFFVKVHEQVKKILEEAEKGLA